MAQWVAAGEITLPEYLIDGDIVDFPEVFAAMYAGENLGKTVLRLPAANNANK